MARDLTRIAWLALLIVDEAAEAGSKAPIEPSPGLRLALAYLHSIADGPIFALPSRRHVFDELWRIVTAPLASGNPHSAAYARSSMVESCLQQIGRQIGQHANVFNTVREFRTREVEPDARKELARAVRQTGGYLDQRKDDKRRHYWRPPPRPKVD